LLEPALRTARTRDRLSAAGRAALRERLASWLAQEISRQLKALQALADAAGDPRTTPGVRALAAMLADSGGVLPRRSVLGAIGHLEQDDRRALYRLKVRLGPLDVFVPELLRPAAQYWRSALVAVKSGETMPELPPAGATILPSEADARGAALAFRRLGRRWLRIDLADRLASHARQVRDKDNQEPLDRAFATSLGLDEAMIDKLMAEIGFVRAGDSWRWRGRRPPRREARHSPANQFAALAELKRRR
jgi:ATP-dependent RNA helicase SUPV3L1/SUV3